MDKKIFITSALPYCNNVPHLGNLIGSTLSGDFYSRFKKLQGYKVLYLCGTDDYGATSTIKAIQEKTTPKDICEKYSKLHKQIYDWFNIDFDVWGKTSTSTQTELTQQIFLKLYENGYIEEKTDCQMYCDSCQMFIADRYLKGICYHEECKDKNSVTNGDQCDTCQKFIDVDKIINPFCYLCNEKPRLKETEHLYLKLGDLTEKIKKYNFDNPNISLSVFDKSVVKSWIDKGLESRCITRDLKWGTPVPWEHDELLKKYKDKVFYVWFDAVFGYLSILKDNREDWKEWIQNIDWIQCMSDDNIAFHNVMLVGSILGSGLNLPLGNKLCTTRYLLYEGEKFSKSNNIGIFGNQAMDISAELNITEDHWRFYLIKIRPENHTSCFIWEDFVATINNELVGNIGNFINRCVSMSRKYNDTLYVFDEEFSEKMKKTINTYVEHFDNFEFKNALKICLDLSSLGNKFLQDQKPWKIKDESEIKRVLGRANTICYILLFLLKPIVPRSSENLIKIYNISSLENLSTLEELKLVSEKPDKKIKLDMDKYRLPFKKIN